MIKPYQITQNLDRTINSLKYQLRYSKNKKEADKALNELTKVKKDLDFIFNNTFYTDILETLVLDLILTKIRLESKLEDKYIIDLNFYLASLGQIIKDGKDLKAAELISYLKLPYEKMMVEDFEERQDAERSKKILDRIPTDEKLLSVLDQFFNILKTDIKLKTK